MITMKITTGVFAGRVREVSSVDPMELLSACLGHGDHWSLDFSQATPEEMFLWGKADMVCRIILALQEGRQVILAFPERRLFYASQENEDLEFLAGQIEDAIVESGYIVFVSSDTEIGVTIETAGTEHPKQ